MAKWRDSGDEPKERENECLAIERERQNKDIA